MPTSADVLSVFRSASGARDAGICPGLPLLSGRKLRPDSPLCGMRCLLVGVFPYFRGASPGSISLYARGADYHEVILPRLARAACALSALFPDARFAPGCDASPIDEVRCAVAAGLGVRGDNGLFLSPRYGSFVFLGTLACDLDLPAAAHPAEGCRHCGACAAACPTGSVAKGTRTHCLSALTQRRGALTEEEAALLRSCGSVWGCDRCQLVCPYNQAAERDPLPEFCENSVSDLPSELLSASPAEWEIFLRGRAFAWRGHEVLARNLGILSKK